MYTHREVQILVVRGFAVTLVTHKDTWTRKMAVKKGIKKVREGKKNPII